MIQSLSKYLPNKGLKGFPVLELVVEYDDIVNAATCASCSYGSVHLEKNYFVF